MNHTDKRILAIDILRGITISGMILVNNPGSWNHIYAPLQHAEWNGLTPTDLVFPFFMFIMGISTYISLRKFNFECNHDTFMKIMRRTVFIFLIGMAVGWFSRFCYYWTKPAEGIGFSSQLWEAIWTFDRMRILGVMQRLALCYGTVSVIAITMRHKHIPYLIASLLTGYGIILLYGNGFAYNESNILSVIDRAILTPAHMYKDHGIDPEGLLSTIPSVAQVLIGFYIGKLMLDNNRKHSQDSLLNAHLNTLFIAGTAMMFTGMLLSYGCPVNKKIWSPTYVLVTCGMAASLLALLIWLIDVKGYRQWSRFFEVFGVNPLFMYVLGGVLSILFGSIQIPWHQGTVSIHGLLYTHTLQPILGNLNASLAYALLFVVINWLVGYSLYKRKIFIKL